MKKKEAAGARGKAREKRAVSSSTLLFKNKAEDADANTRVWSDIRRGYVLCNFLSQPWILRR